MKDLTRTETEIEILKQKLIDNERQAKIFEKTSSDILSNVKSL
jgi:hypothetical protein